MSTMGRREFSLALAAGATAGWSGGRTVADSTAGSEETPDGLTAVPGVKVGHFTETRRPTGCTVILTEGGAVCGVDVRGGAPGTRETDLLDPVNSIQEVHGIVLSGGSAFGLDAATGVMRFLDEREIGFPVGEIKVPIVPAAILFDLFLGDGTVRPDAKGGYEAARTASDGPVAEGCVGAGAGATVGKLFGLSRAMKGGVGTASVRLSGGAVVAALVAVNALGDVIDPGGRVVAGARDPEGTGFVGSEEALLRGGTPERPLSGENTTIGVVATNVGLKKHEAKKVAQMAQDGLARSIRPVHTPWDGDTLFAVSTGHVELTQAALLVGTAAAAAVARAVVRAVETATGLPGLPSASDLGRG